MELKGFRGVRETLRIDVPHGFLIIVGRNGSGKSTVCDAVDFALTGKIREQAHRERGESYADYLWWRGRGEASERYVRVGFVDDAGNSHEIKRTPQGIARESYAVLNALASEEGAPENPLEAMCRTSLIRDEEITTLSVDLPEGERYRFVRDALGTVSFTDVERRLEEARNHADEQARQEQTAYAKLRDKIADTTARLSALQSRTVQSAVDSKSEVDLRTLLALPAASRVELLRAGREWVVRERLRSDKLSALLLEHGGFIRQRERVLSKSFVDERTALEAEIKRLETEVHQYASAQAEALAALDAIKEGESTRVTQTELLERGERIGLADGDVCPLCGSIVTLDEFRRHIASAREEISAAAKEVVAAVRHQQETQKAAEDASRDLAAAERRLDAHLTMEKSLDASLQRIVAAAGDLGVNAEAGDNLAKALTSQIQLIQSNIHRAEQGAAWLESFSFTELARAAETELSQFKKASDEAFVALTRSEKKLSTIKDAQNSVKSLLGEVIDEQLSQLSPLIEEIYRRLRPHIEWASIRYRLRGDVRRLLRFEVGDGLNPSFVFSSGQRRAAGLAFLLAVHLSRPWCRLGTLLLDDPVQHVDDFRALNLTEVLVGIRKAGRQILCCVEDEALGRLMCRRLRDPAERSGKMVHLRFDPELGVVMDRESELSPLSHSVLVPA